MEIKKHAKMVHVWTKARVTITDVFEDTEGNLKVSYEKKEGIRLFDKNKDLTNRIIKEFTKPYYVFVQFYKATI